MFWFSDEEYKRQVAKAEQEKEAKLKELLEAPTTSFDYGAYYKARKTAVEKFIADHDVNAYAETMTPLQQALKEHEDQEKARSAAVAEVWDEFVEKCRQLRQEAQEREQADSKRFLEEDFGGDLLLLKQTELAYVEQAKEASRRKTEAQIAEQQKVTHFALGHRKTYCGIWLNAFTPAAMYLHTIDPEKVTCPRCMAAMLDTKKWRKALGFDG